MVNSCAVVGCSKRSDKEEKCSFFRLPGLRSADADELTKRYARERREAWIRSLKREDLKASDTLDHIRVCSNHFTNRKPSSLMQKADADWIPHLNMGHNSLAIFTPTSASSRHDRRKNRNLKRRLCLTAIETTKPKENIPPPDFSIVSSNLITSKSVEIQTDLTISDIGNLEQHWFNINAELKKTKQLISNIAPISEEQLKDSPEKVFFFTGLPSFSFLLLLFNFTHPYISYLHNKNSLTIFQEFLVVLLKLRLNLQFQDIGYRFDISKSTASRIFHKWIPILANRLHFLIKWPDREQLWKTMPYDFIKVYGKKCVCIIDCFEVFCERPSNLSARGSTWSNYKHHNTVKFLIGITPQGTVSFISKAWGGRTSDKYPTEACGILRKLLPGDILLADRGFTIEESVSVYQARLEVPSFTKGKTQLSALEVEKSREISNVRIHVERVIGVIRQKYQILSGTLPIDFLTKQYNNKAPIIDEIASVCCCLVNLNDSVVPRE